jgi:hypothetical protein
MINVAHALSNVPVGRTPWSAADALVGSSLRATSRTRGSGADGGVCPTSAFIPMVMRYAMGTLVRAVSRLSRHLDV